MGKVKIPYYVVAKGRGYWLECVAMAFRSSLWRRRSGGVDDCGRVE